MLFFILVFATVIIIHEAGHYVFARVFGVRVKRVSLFFNLFFTLLKYNPLTGRLDFLSVKRSLSQIKDDGEEIVAEATRSVLSIRIINSVDNVEAWDKRTGHLFRPKRFEVNTVIMDGRSTEETRQWRLTQYCLGWLPFGGYVTMDYEGSDGLFSKKTHQQMLVNLGGIIFNMAAVLIVVIGLLCVRMSFESYESCPPSLRLIVAYSGGVMYMNWWLGCLNVLPLPPLDGYHALRCILPEKWKKRITGVIEGIVGLIIFIFFISSWFRESFAFEEQFVSNVFEILDLFLRWLVGLFFPLE